jgi:hypothetical protein
MTTRETMMRFVLCLLLAVSLPGSALAAKRTLNLTQAQAAAAKGDANAAAAIQTTTDKDTCLNECANRGHNKNQCASACRPGFCHPDDDTPYCIMK